VESAGGWADERGYRTKPTARASPAATLVRHPSVHDHGPSSAPRRSLANWGIPLVALLILACTSEVPQITRPATVRPAASSSAVVPFPTPERSIPGPEPTSAAPSPTPSTVASPSIEPETPPPTPMVSPEPTPVSSPSASPGPPYVLLNHAGPQDPHTILFGQKRGDGFSVRSEAWSISTRDIAFAAYFGEPARSRQLTFTLYRIDGVRHSVVWSVTQPIAKDAIGFIDTLAAVRVEGVYGLGVSRGINLLAWGSFVVLPPCVGICTGG
jgi:hypothetical protein